MDQIKISNAPAPSEPTAEIAIFAQKWTKIRLAKSTSQAIFALKWTKIRLAMHPRPPRIEKRAFQIRKERTEKLPVDARIEKRAFQIRKERVEKPLRLAFFDEK